MAERLGDPLEDGATERRVTRTLGAHISREMVRLMSRYMGRGPTKARTTVNNNLVAVVFEDALTKGERNLVAAGQTDSVMDMRRSFHSLMRDDAIEMVEALVGRKVTAFLSDVDPNENVAAQLFVLERRADTALAEALESATGSDGAGPG